MQIKFDFSSKKGVLVVKFAFATAILKIETLRMRRHFACVPAGPGRIVVNNATVLPVCLWKEDNSDYRLFGNFYLQALLSSCQGADILFLQASQYCHSVNRNHCSRNYFLCFKSVGRENVSQIFHRKLWNFEKAKDLIFADRGFTIHENVMFQQAQLAIPACTRGKDQWLLLCWAGSVQDNKSIE